MFLSRRNIKSVQRNICPREIFLYIQRLKNIDDKLLLEQYRDFLINREEFQKAKHIINTKFFLKNPGWVNAQNIINALNKYRNKDISREDLLHWAQIMAFSDWYDYVVNECESKASVIDYLESLDEHENEISEEEINKYIFALERNIDVHELDRNPQRYH